MDDDKIPSRSRWNPNAAATIRWHGYKSISIVISSDTPKAREAAEAGQALTHFQLPPTKNCNREQASESVSHMGRLLITN